MRASVLVVLGNGVVLVLHVRGVGIVQEGE